MKSRMLVSLLWSLVVMLALAPPAEAKSSPGAVYSATNTAAGNRVVIFDRDADGSLSYSHSIATGGLGTGTGLGNQGGVLLTNDHQFFFVVNAGSNEISSFSIGADGLTLVDVIHSSARVRSA